MVTYTSPRAHYKRCDTITTIPQALLLWRHCHYGGRGIRTPGAVNPAVFKTAAIVHSAIPPLQSIPHPLSTLKEGMKKGLLLSSSNSIRIGSNVVRDGRSRKRCGRPGSALLARSQR